MYAIKLSPVRNYFRTDAYQNPFNTVEYSIIWKSVRNKLQQNLEYAILSKLIAYRISLLILKIESRSPVSDTYFREKPIIHFLNQSEIAE